MIESWWNSNFKIRRQLFVPQTVFDDDNHCIVQLRDGFANSFKTRTDYQDLEIVYYNDIQDEWIVLGSKFEEQIENDEPILNIRFARFNQDTSSSDNYYLYTSNQSLAGINYHRPLLPLEQGFYVKPGITNAYYTSSTGTSSISPIPSHPGNYESNIFFSQEAVIEKSPRFTTSKPTEDWIDGLAKRQNASANFIYSGGGCALRYESGPDRGILSVVTNPGNTSIEIDTFNPTYRFKVHQFSDDIISNHGFSHSFFVTGDKSPSSESYSIKIDRMLFTHYDLVTYGTEEIFDGGNEQRIVIGV